MKTQIMVILAVFFIALMVCSIISAATKNGSPWGPTTKVSKSYTGGNGDDDSYNSAVSADGRFVVYQSAATNIVSGDTNGVDDIFLYDKVTGKTIRANRGPAGAQAVGGYSFDPKISGDGRYIVYTSFASNLVSGDTNGKVDVFIYDRVTDKTIRANRGPANAQAVGGESYRPSISADGRYVVYDSVATNLVSGDTNGVSDVFLYDTKLKTTIRANRGPAGAQSNSGASYEPVISGDGRYIVYRSAAANLVSGDTNNYYDVFLYDRVLNKTIRANRGPAGAQAVGGDSTNPSISGNGKYIIYESGATNLVSGDTNGKIDVFSYVV